jgi:hypothetical protein
MKVFYRRLAICIIVLSIVYFVSIYSLISYSTRLGESYVTPFVASGIAAITSIIALLKDLIIGFLTAPYLRIKIFPYDKRDCHLTQIIDPNTGQFRANAYYFRLRVYNEGFKTAEDVEVTLEEVVTKEGNIEASYMPLRLLWSHWRNTRYELSIPSDTYRHCDFAYILDRKISDDTPATKDGNFILWFDVFIRPNTGKTYLLPGEYKIKLSAFGRNAKKAEINIGLLWRGQWKENIGELLDSSLIIKT